MVNIFDAWSNISAYLLGLFYADGHFDDNCLLTFRSKDKLLVQLVRNAVRYGTIRKATYPTKAGPKSIYRLSFGGNLGRSLRCLGMPFSPKAANLKWPMDLPPHLTRDFIRGFFDGDGSVDKNFPHLIFCSSSLSFLLSLEHIGHALGCYSAAPYLMRNPYGSCWTLSYGQVTDVALWTMYMYLYPTARLYLARKRDLLFQNMGVDIVPSTPDLHRASF